MQRILSRIPPLAFVLIIAAVMRIGMVVWKFDNLSVDRDAYGVIAANLLAGHGFCSEIGKPTAFRPPLYPILIATCRMVGGAVMLAAVHVALGTATVAITWRLAERVGLPPAACLAAAGLVAVDPLLLLYTTHLMTETLFTFLIGGLLMSLQQIESNRHAAVAGLWFGLAAMCRPTVWAFAALAGMCLFAVALLRQTRRQSGDPRHRRYLVAFCVTAVLVVSPWMLRNQIVQGHPTMMTTHGGYTLLLGNNAVFYEDVVANPDQSVWPGDSLKAWQQSLEAELQSDGQPLTEHQRSQRLRDMAVDWIRRNPGPFLECVWLRICRLWSPVPENTDGVPKFVSVTVGAYYLAVYGLFVGALVRHRANWRNLWWMLAFLASLTALHSVYWANARMRAPAIPVVAVLAAAAISATGGPHPWRCLPVSRTSGYPGSENKVNPEE